MLTKFQVPQWRIFLYSRRFSRIIRLACKNSYRGQNLLVFIVHLISKEKPAQNLKKIGNIDFLVDKQPIKDVNIFK